MKCWCNLCGVFSDETAQTTLPHWWQETQILQKKGRLWESVISRPLPTQDIVDKHYIFLRLKLEDSWGCQKEIIRTTPKEVTGTPQLGFQDWYEAFWKDSNHQKGNTLFFSCGILLKGGRYYAKATIEQSPAVKLLCIARFKDNMEADSEQTH